MTAERWTRVERLFHDTLAQPAALRERFLADACEDDSALIAEVRSLVAQASVAAQHSLPDERPRHLTPWAPGAQAGRRVGQYVLQELLGAGGMGEVYRARDERLERDVAIKLLHPWRLGDTGLLREAKSAARLNHPNVCTVFEVGSCERGTFVVMEQVQGRTLADLVRDGRVHLTAVVDYGIQMADALAHAHEHGVVHRDFKSSNVMVGAEGRLKVLDFGIARVADPTVAPPPSDTSLGPAGTPAYMAPEVLAGARADARSDIWALGVCLYELACGALPFRETNPFKLAADILHGSPAPLPPDLPPPLAQVITRCLAREPAGRFASARDVGAGLKACRATAPERTERLPAGGDARLRRARLRRRSAAVLAASLVALAVVSAWALDQYRRVAAPLTLAVLPLHVSGEHGSDRGTAIADGVITRLAELGSLQVRPTAVVRRYAQSSTAVRPVQVARELRAEYLLFGNFRATPEGHEVNLQLVRGRDESIAWSDEFVFPSAHLDALEEVIGERVARALSSHRHPRGRRLPPEPDTNNAAARSYYLAGRALLVQLKKPAEAVSAFEEAIRLDRSYALAYAGLATALARQAWHGSHEEATGHRERALQAAETAVHLAPRLGEAHEALAAVHRYSDANWDKCIAASRRALALNPRLELPHHHLAAAFYHVGLLEYAEQASLDGLAVNPQSRTQSVINRARAAFYSGRYREADQLMAEIDKSRDDGDAWLRSEIRFYLGDHRASIVVLAELASTGAAVMRARARASLASVLAALGQRTAAETWLDQLTTTSVTDHHVTYRIATAYAQLGMAAEAVRWLRRTAETGFPCYAWFEKDPLLDPVRTDRSFRELLASLRADWQLRRARHAAVRHAVVE